MIRIKYPVDELKKQIFNDLYVKCLSVSVGDILKIDSLLGKVFWEQSPMNFLRLILAEFSFLREMNNLIFHHLSTDELEELYKYFNYESKQQNIARFFMLQRDVNLDSCYYCNLDNIYSFSDMNEYVDGLDFVNGASVSELMLVKGLGKDKANAIIEKREEQPFFNLKKLPVGDDVRGRIARLEINHSHNHFTIDHFHHKDQYDFLSLSLYNFVPSCYSCNSKFKKTKVVGVGTKSVIISPSSDKFSFRNNFSFKLLLQKELHEIVDVNDFSLVFDLNSRDPTYLGFLKTFKIMGRYHFHKDEALRLINKKVEYPESRIHELALLAGKSDDEMRKDLFGEELFDHKYDQKPLVKLKRDIARNIKLNGVVQD